MSKVHVHGLRFQVSNLHGDDDDDYNIDNHDVYGNDEFGVARARRGLRRGLEQHSTKNIKS